MHHAIGFSLRDEKKEVLNYRPVARAIDRIGILLVRTLLKMQFLLKVERNI